MFSLNLFNCFRFCLILLNCFTLFIEALPSGAPVASCQSLSPVHAFAVSRPPGTSPFTVEAVIKRENGKVVVKVDIVPKNNFPSLSPSPTFRGFIAQARLASNPGVIVDAVFFPQEPQLSQTFTCGAGNRQMNTWTHSNALPKRGVSALLLPPPGFSGQIIIKATVVGTVDTWEGLQSNRVNLIIHSPTNSIHSPSNAIHMIEQPAITELLDAVSSHNIMDMEPDLDSEFYGIGDPDEVLYLTPKKDPKKKVVAGKGKEDEGDMDGDKKTDKVEATSKEDKKKCPKPTKKNTLKVEQTAKTEGEPSKKDDNDDGECMEVESQENTKITVDTTKKLTEDDLVVEPLDDLDKDWEEAFNFENV